MADSCSGYRAQRLDAASPVAIGYGRNGANIGRFGAIPRRALRALAAFAFAVALTPDAHAIFIVNDPWVKAAPGARSAEAFMELTSTEGATVLGVRGDGVRQVTIRAPGKSTKTIPELVLAPREALLLAPGKYRLGLIGLAQPLKLGDRVPLVLTIRNSDGTEREIPLSAEVRKRSAIDDHLHGAHTHKH